MSADSDPLRLLVHGASGRMGHELLALAGDPAVPVAVVAALARKVPQRVVDGVPWFSCKEMNGSPAFDVAIDFSLPQAFDAILDLARLRGAALVTGTTGLEPRQQQALEDAARSIAVFQASNFSVGVAVLRRLVLQAARQLPDWDCDIIEAHHVHKRDAPSGTALTLGQVAEAAGAHPRYASLRAGDIVGEHTAQFTGIGERIELVHRASSRAIFARGALQAAVWLARQPPGLYGMDDLLSP